MKKHESKQVIELGSMYVPTEIQASIPHIVHASTKLQSLQQKPGTIYQ
jgi:hypothetical protein